MLVIGGRGRGDHDIGNKENAEEIVIGNPAMGHNRQISRCKVGECGPSVNDPNRGCEKIMRCRRPPALNTTKSEDVKLKVKDVKHY
ncbi:protein ralf-like 28 [Corchorus capsularis]|uniref:Protein ralf-like 28 n=1 Tax=Corchorus capsularis TaxID=210143 RepID=A0A1R3G8Q2_COCAP|nr:protein ralf-like 28 [Corchorus capsularis]